MLPVLDALLPAPARGLFTTRAGGVSGPPWTSLDLALHVQDDEAHVQHNRDLLAGLVGDQVRWPEQVHGAGVAVLDAGSGPDAGAGCDALVTAVPGLPVGVLAADCMPVLLVDPVAGVVGAAHAGRPGLAAGVLPATVQAMVGLGACPSSVVAVVGPAIGGCCYEVPAALRDEVDAAAPGAAATTTWGTPSLDLPAGATAVLTGLGVTVRVLGVCTRTDDRVYSYRRDGLTGRHAGVVVLTP